jgi:hypothetical protein
MWKKLSEKACSLNPHIWNWEIAPCAEYPAQTTVKMDSIFGGIFLITRGDSVVLGDAHHAGHDEVAHVQQDEAATKDRTAFKND